jgi:hypothetical protein
MLRLSGPGDAPPDLAAWVTASAVAQGLKLDDDDITEVTAFVHIAQAMFLLLPDEEEAP